LLIILRKAFIHILIAKLILRAKMPSLKEILGSKSGAVILVTLFVIMLSFIRTDYWQLPVSAIIGYIIADLILTQFVGGGRGAVHIPLLDHLKRTKMGGYVYIAYYIGIVLSTFASAYATGSILSFVQTKFPNDILGVQVAESCVVSFLVYIELKVRYYER